MKASMRTEVPASTDRSRIRSFRSRWARPVLLAGLVVVSAFGVGGCGSGTGATEDFAQLSASWKPLPKLSQYGLFVGNGSTQEPAEGVVPYDLSTPLFSDYASKHRFVRLPDGTSAEYHETEIFEFPVGTIIAKTFAYPVDARDPSKGERLLETRLLVRKSNGWAAIPYKWNSEQTEAVLDVAGSTVDVEWTHFDGSQRSVEYIIPNRNQCISCHGNKEKEIHPIGPKARNLNKDYDYSHGTENQLAFWNRVGILPDSPSPEDAPWTPIMDDPHSGTLDERARAYLDTNCAHCHNPEGPARMSGLDLRYVDEVDEQALGIWKLPVAAGRGSGGRRYDIVPGEPEESILLYRMESTEPSVMMPELPRRLVHDEGVALIQEWIAKMPKESGRSEKGDS